MRVVPAFAALALAFFSHLPVSARPACADSALRINELMAGPARDWDGSGVFSSRDDEWVELINTGPTSIDLTGHLITDADRLPRFAPTGMLGPGERLLVYGGQAWEWERANGHPAFGLSLGNSGDTVMLWQVTGTDTALVDSYAYTSHQAAADRAVGLATDGSGWVLFDGLNPYTGTTPPMGNGCNPTPGAANDCGTTPTRMRSWGEMKSLYR